MKRMNLGGGGQAGIAAALVLVWVSAVMVGPVLGAERLRWGVLPVVDTLPLLVGEAQGFFQAQQIDLELVAFQSALERDAALQAGKLDGYFGDILNTVLLIQSGQRLRIITTAFHTQADDRMFGIAAGPQSRLATLRDLKGQTVAISRATIIEYLLERLLQAQGLAPDFVRTEEIKKIPIRLQMLLQGQVPAAVLPEPLLTLAESRGATVLLDDRRLDVTETVLAINTSRSAGERSVVKRFLTAYAAAVANINKNPEAFKTLLIERTRFPMPVKERYRVPRFPPVAPPPRQDISDTQQWLKDHKMVTELLPYDQIVLDVSP